MLSLRSVTVALAAALVAPVLTAAPAFAAVGELDVAFLNVGQGDASLFRGPCGEVALMDAGDGSASAVFNQLEAWDTGALAWAVATHYDSDHLGDIRNLDGIVDVPVMYDRGGGPDAKTTATYDAYYAFAEGRQHTALDIGDVISLCSGEDAVTFTVMSAGTDGTAATELPVSEENDRGLCFKVVHRDFDLATCGDNNGVDDGSRSDVESAVAASLGDVDVAKANHHGSPYSSNATYVDTLMAQVAIISVGLNGYGHPSVDVIDRWLQHGDVYVTEDPDTGAPFDGTITVHTSGVDEFRVSTSESATALTYLIDQNLDSGSPPVDEPPPPPPAAAPAARSADDSCPAGAFPDDGFIDVPEGATHETAIDCLVWWKVAAGRSSIRYVPGDGVTRDAMATFIARAIDKTGGGLPSSPPDAFMDDNQNVHQHAINQLAAVGIVSGTGPVSYSPGRVVTRGQMAKFLANGAAFVLGGPLTADFDYFTDDASSQFQPFINQVAQAGFTGGRPDGTYGVDGTVTREQMASFLARLLDLLVESGRGTSPPVTSTPTNPGDAADCRDFATQADAQRYHDYHFPHYGDMANLDGDRDGQACEVDAPPPPPPPPSKPASPGDSKNCGDFSRWRDAQDWFEYYYPHYGDVARLDADADRIACESLPGAP